MRSLFGLCVCVTALLPLVACETTGAVPTEPLMVLARHWDPDVGISGPLLEDVEICQAGTNNCAMTDEGGMATLELPADQEISYTLVREGYASYLEATIVPEGGTITTRYLATEERIAEQYAQIDSPYPMEGTGTIFVEAVGAGATSGATFTLIDGTGTAFYRDEAYDFSTELTSTTSAGGGGFSEVSPGVYQLELGEAASTCEHGAGWPGDAPNTIRLPVREGYNSRGGWVCPL